MKKQEHSLTVLCLAGFVVWLSYCPMLTQAQDFEFNLGRSFARAISDSAFGQDSQERLLELPQFSAFAHSSFLGESAAYQDVYGLNAVFANSGFGLADASDYSGQAETQYDVQIKSTSSGSGSIPFKFVINGGQMRLNDYQYMDSSIVSFSEARVHADIALFGIGSWEMRAVLELDDNTREPIVYIDSFSRDDFGLGFPALTVDIIGDDAVVDIPRFEGVIQIPFSEFGDNGQSFRYNMLAGLDLYDSFGASGFAAITDPFGLESGDPNAIPGTEFFLNDQPFSYYPISSVPEPTSCLFLAIGLASLGLRRNRNV